MPQVGLSQNRIITHALLLFVGGRVEGVQLHLERLRDASPYIHSVIAFLFFGDLARFTVSSCSNTYPGAALRNAAIRNELRGGERRCHKERLQFLFH